jgi:pimeloyl-ACP methyl ester carboxylesterase
MGHYLAASLVERGYAFLGWNNRFVGADPFFRPDEALSDVGLGVSLMRERFENVVLLGNSGGGSLMSAYQSQAGGSDFIASAMQEIYGSAHPRLDALEQADAYIALNAHESRPKILTEWFDPSVVDERDPFTADPSLDLWGAVAGEPPYPEQFVRVYRAAQVRRNERITAWVRGQLSVVKDHGGSERLFNVYRAWADPRYLDMTIDPSDRVPGCYLSPDVRAANYSAYGLASSCSLKTWLAMWSLDYDVLNVAKHLPHVTVPALVVQGTADQGVHPSNAHALHDNLGASDKSLVWVKDGGHYLEGEHVEFAADAIASWLSDHGFTA